MMKAYNRLNTVLIVVDVMELDSDVLASVIWSCGGGYCGD